MAPSTRRASRRLSQSPNPLMSKDISQSHLPPSTGHVPYFPGSTSVAATATDMSERNIFRFMDLPSELRLHIYRMALQRDKPLLLHLPRSRYTDDGAFSDSEGPATTDIARTPEQQQQSPRTEVETNGHIIIRYPQSDLRLRPGLLARELGLSRSSSSASSSSLSGTGAAAVAAVGAASIAMVPVGGSSSSASATATTTTASASMACGPGGAATIKGINTDPLVPEILCVSRQVYREARPVLYADNEFVLLLGSARRTLGSLHQRSRSLLRHVHLTIPSHQDVLEGFADVIRLGIRYCWGLKRLTLTLPDSFPEDQNSALSGQLSVYANAFYILRWLPKGCEVKLLGDKIPADVRRIIDENEKLAETLDDTAYAKRHLQMPDGYRRRR